MIKNFPSTVDNMAFTSYFKVFLITISLALGSQFALTYLKKRKARKSVHEVIMFSSNLGEFRKSKYSRCIISHSMDRLLHHLNSPKCTLDICMYVFTNLDIANAVLKMNLKGIKIRVIVDADMAYSCGSVIKKLEKHGIPVRWMKSTNLMHHKFALIDAYGDHAQVTPVVMMGSLNWTNQALSGNWEDVAVTSQEELVEQYRDEFERLWSMFQVVYL